MKIGIDGSPLSIPYPCGIKTHATALLKNLADVDHDNEYQIFCERKEDVPAAGNFRFIPTRKKMPGFNSRLVLQKKVDECRPDLFHFLYPTGGIFFRHPAIVTTVHDLDLNWTYPWTGKYFFHRTAAEISRKRLFNRTKLFICVSEFTRRELENLLAGTVKKPPIRVIYPGPDPTVFKIHKLDHDKKNEPGFFLSFGDFTKRKNVFAIMQAYSLLDENLKHSYRLKLVASTASAAAVFKNLGRTAGIWDYLDIFTDISDKQLVGLYGGATALVYVSRYEGFGLPILEAMACGCPVITSDTGAMKEVAGQAALTVDPTNPEAIAKGMMRIATDSNLRFGLVRQGENRVGKFSMRNNALQTIQVYRQVQKTAG